MRNYGNDGLPSSFPTTSTTPIQKKQYPSFRKLYYEDNLPPTTATSSVSLLSSTDFEENNNLPSSPGSALETIELPSNVIGYTWGKEQRFPHFNEFELGPKKSVEYPHIFEKPITHFERLHKRNLFHGLAPKPTSHKFSTSPSKSHSVSHSELVIEVSSRSGSRPSLVREECHIPAVVQKKSFRKNQRANSLQLEPSLGVMAIGYPSSSPTSSSNLSSHLSTEKRKLQMNQQQQQQLLILAPENESPYASHSPSLSRNSSITNPLVLEPIFIKCRQTVNDDEDDHSTDTSSATSPSKSLEFSDYIKKKRNNSLTADINKSKSVPNSIPLSPIQSNINKSSSSSYTSSSSTPQSRKLQQQLHKLEKMKTKQPHEVTQEKTILCSSEKYLSANPVSSSLLFEKSNASSAAAVIEKLCENFSS